MIQFNLLPDVKLEFIKARRMKRLVTLVSVSVSVIALFVLVLFFLTVNVVQKKSLSDVNDDIKSGTRQLQSIPDLDKVLTVQNQLNTLTGLHDKKAVASRLFGYLAQVMPNGVTASSLSVDFAQNTLTMSGNAPDLATVNTFIDSLKATTYKTDKTDAQPAKAFSGIVLNSFSRGDTGTVASYGTNFSFDPLIFDATNKVTLSVPQGTVSNTSALFKGSTK